MNDPLAPDPVPEWFVQQYLGSRLDRGAHLGIGQALRDSDDELGALLSAHASAVERVRAAQSHLRAMQLLVGGHLARHPARQVSPEGIGAETASEIRRLYAGDALGEVQ